MAATVTIERLAPRRVGVVLWVLAVLVGATATRAAPDSVYLEELTWVETAERIAGGATTALLPIGGTEQNGPHMVLGKHNLRAQVLAGRIATALGQTLVAPVLAYVPEGAVNPPAAHMRFAGTISVPEAAFEALLEGAARSLRQHGFREVVLLGDHGGYLKSLDRVAARLNREWAGKSPAARALAPAAYYRASVDGHAELLAARGFAKAEIGSHAGLADTALALSVAPALVRTDQLARAAKAGEREGVHGDPRRASAELGRLGVERIVEATVAAIRAGR